MRRLALAEGNPDCYEVNPWVSSWEQGILFGYGMKIDHEQGSWNVLPLAGYGGEEIWEDVGCDSEKRMGWFRR